MKLENTVCFRCDLYKCPDSHKFYNAVKPNNCINSSWISQTIGDQIWMWFEFANIDDKREYLEKIKELTVSGEYELINEVRKHSIETQICKPIDMLMNGEVWLTQAEMDHWTGIDTGYVPINPTDLEGAIKKLEKTLRDESIWDKIESLIVNGIRLK